MPNTSPDAARKAREQAAEYDSIFADVDLELDDGSVVKIPPHPDLGMIDDDRMEAYEELMFEVEETYEREEDIIIPEQRLRDPDTGKETGVVIPQTVQRGMVKRPYRKVDEEGNSHLVKPPHSVKVVMAAIGDDEYARLRAGGRSAKDVWRIWNERGMELTKRRNADAKSNGSPVGLAAVPTADS